MHALNTAANMYATEATMTGKSPYSTSVASKSSTLPMPVSKTASRSKVQAGMTPASTYAYITGMPKI